MAVLPAEIPTGLITGQYYFVNEDNIDADTKPELTVVTGTVTFTCSVKTLRMPAKKAVLVPLRFDAEFDSQGNLKPVNGTGVGIELPATNSPLLTEQDYTWKVEFNLKEVATDFTVNLDSFDIQVPVDSTQDLSVLMPVATSPGTITIQGGPQGEPGEQGPTGKTPNIKVGTVVTGTPNPGPAGVKGDKGDPGGIVAGTVLGTTHLDTLKAAGTYIQPTSANGTVANGYPTEAVAGNLLILAQGSFTSQFFYPFNGAIGQGVYWMRIFNTTWLPWRAYTKTRVDQTAGRAIYQWDEINNREQLIYGDTGRRNISSFVTAPTPTSGTITIRRVGSIVTLNIVDLLFSSALAGNTYVIPAGSLPVGFRPNGAASNVNGVLINGEGNSNPIFSRILVQPDGSVRFGPTGAFLLNGLVSWDTVEAWPTTLPGTAVGTIPNL